MFCKFAMRNWTHTRQATMYTPTCMLVCIVANMMVCLDTTTKTIAHAITIMLAVAVTITVININMGAATTTTTTLLVIILAGAAGCRSPRTLPRAQP